MSPFTIYMDALGIISTFDPQTISNLTYGIISISKTNTWLNVIIPAAQFIIIFPPYNYISTATIVGPAVPLLMCKGTEDTQMFQYGSFVSYFKFHSSGTTIDAYSPSVTNFSYAYKKI